MLWSSILYLGSFGTVDDLLLVAVYAKAVKSTRQAPV